MHICHIGGPADPNPRPSFRGLEESHRIGRPAIPEPRQITALLELERDEEGVFSECLTAAERGERGTQEHPAPKDYFAHVIGGKRQMLQALVAARTGAVPDASHDAQEVFEANADRSFDDLEREAGQVAADLRREVEHLDRDSLGSSPEWVSDDTLADEIIQQCVTHGLVQLFEPLCARGHTDQALQTQLRFIAALPPDTSVLQRSRALYNLGCLHLRAGHADDAVISIRAAGQLRPTLLEHARQDPELAPIKDGLSQDEGLGAPLGG
jgi:hypothetical protein